MALAWETSEKRIDLKLGLDYALYRSRLGRECQTGPDGNKRIARGQCKRACPQRLPILRELPKAAAHFGKQAGNAKTQSGCPAFLGA